MRQGERSRLTAVAETRIAIMEWEEDDTSTTWDVKNKGEWKGWKRTRLSSAKMLCDFSLSFLSYRPRARHGEVGSRRGELRAVR
jgi:hypothetical protein